ncbi:MlaD family protein [Nocardia sp. NPDC055321]
MSIATVTALSAVVLAGYSLIFDTDKEMRSYCALMPDAIGLYVGNHVTLSGVPVGSVSGIEPVGEKVRVDFEVDAAHPLRGQAGATTVSHTLVADRDLEVLSEHGGAEWDSRTCLTRTLTPKSMTQTINALGKLADELGGGTDPAQSGQVRQAISALDAATTGTGPRINQLIKQLGVALSSPDAAIGHIGELIDALSSLAHSASTGWGDIKALLLPFSDTLEFVNEKMWVPITEIVDSLRVLIPLLNDITTTFGAPIREVLDASVPALRLLAANVGSLQSIVGMIPPIAGAFDRSIDPGTGRPVLTYALPRLSLPPGQAESVCAAINALTPGRCSSAADGLAGLALIPLVLGLAGNP